MHSLRIRNLRSLVDTKKIDLKTVNILVGRNSSGKSSFLRFFPLFKQSAMSSSSSPLLWFGEGDAVDYGDFSNAISRQCNDNCIHIEIEFELSSEELMNIQQGSFGFRTYREALEGASSVVTRFSIKESTEGLEKYEFYLKIKNTEVSYDFFKGQLVRVSLDSVELDNIPAMRINSFSGLVPEIISYSIINNGADDLIKKIFSNELPLLNKETPLRTYFTERYLTPSLTMFEDSIISEEILSNILELLVRTKADRKKFSRKIIEKIENDTETKRKIREQSLLRITPQIFKVISEHLNDFAKGVRYLGPVRATASRYYRQQNLSVQEIDYQGRNVAVFLSQLNEHDRIQFEDWMSTNMGYTFFAESSGNHIEIKIKDEHGQIFNMADMGFGYSQILPVLTQIWLSTQNTFIQASKSPQIIAIEQPELHLHPNMQYMLGRLIAVSAQIINDNGIDVRLILETHSEHLINGIGSAVDENLSPSTLFNVITFEKPSDGMTKIKQLKFNKSGLISNWPIGFLEPKYI